MAAGEGRRSRAVEWLRPRLPRRIREGLADVSGEDLLLHAAGVAFYALVSLIPLTMFAMWAASLLAGDDRVERLAEVLAHVAPQGLGADRALLRVAELGTSVGVASMLLALWPATAYGSGLARAFRRLSPIDPPEELRGLWGRVVALIVLLPLFVLGSLVGAFGATSLFREGLLRAVGWLLALVLSFVGAGLATALIYRVFPPERLRWRAILHGTVAAAVGIALLTVAYAALLGLGADFTQHYAISGVAGMVLLAVWLFVANALVLVGYKVALDAGR